MENITSTFKYKPLKEKEEIRLLVLHPAAKSNDDIRCNIIHSTLQNDDPYEALSYMWGNPDTLPIILRNETFNVTVNLEAALRELRSPSENRTLWVDAICINQKDDAEKGQQVSMMGEIYKAASGVLLWLGPVATPSGTPLTLSDCTLGLWKNSFTPDLWKGGNEAKKCLSALEKDEFEQVFRDFLEAQKRPVWRRAWINQEVILAKDVTVVWGSHLIHWWNLVHMYTGFARIPLDPCAESYQAELVRRELFIDMGGSVLGRRLHYISGTRQSFLEMYKDEGGFASTLGADRIYSVLGLVKNNFGIVPSYDKPLKEVLGNFVKAHIDHSKDLNILEIGSLQTRGPSSENASLLPSWAPDLASGFSFPNPLDKRGKTPGYHAGRKGFMKGDPILDGNKLTIWGVRLDEVKSISWTTSVAGWSPCDYRTMLTRDLPLDPSGRYFNGESKFDAYWRTLVFDNNSREEGHRRLRTCDLGIFRAAVRSILRTDLQMGWWSTLVSWFSDRYFRWLWHQRLEKTKIAMTSSFDCGRRRFYFGGTETGYMAMLPGGTQQGDVVCILYGGKAPFILRPSPEPEANTYLLVGPAYVHGFMDGEAISSRNQRQFKDCKFVLI